MQMDTLAVMIIPYQSLDGRDVSPKSLGRILSHLTPHLVQRSHRALPTVILTLHPCLLHHRAQMLIFPENANIRLAPTYALPIPQILHYPRARAGRGRDNGRTPNRELGACASGAHGAGTSAEGRSQE